MCGIVGGALTRPLGPSGCTRRSCAFTIVAPISNGRWVAADQQTLLGHTRLSIIGLDNGAQPMSNHDAGLQMVVNGEFYGYLDIRQQLLSEGYVFATDSDSEIALFGDVFGSSLLDDQPIYDPKRVRGLFSALPTSDPASRMQLDGILNRVLSVTLMHQRFAMSA